MESASSSVFVAKAIKWAMHSKKQIDMFVVISHNQVKTVGAHPALKSYQTELNSPNTKYVFLILFAYAFTSFSRYYIYSSTAYNKV